MDFWLGSGREFPAISEAARNALLPFYTRDSCKAELLAWTIIKSKYQSTLKNIEDALCLLPYQIFSQDFILYIKINTSITSMKIYLHH